MASILETLNQRKILISDGAWGTFLHQSGLKSGDCPELWNVTHREVVLSIAKSYIDAGADMILTNSFGGSPSKLRHYGLDDRTFELNKAAAIISREAAGKDKLVLGSIGPTGVIMMMQEAPYEYIFEGFKTQAEGLVEGGVDAICIETISEIDEALTAIRAVKEISDVEIICTFTFGKTVDGKYKTMMGTTPTEMVQSIKDSGVSIIGANCGNGFDNMVEIVKEIRDADKITPVLIHANAGIPIFHEGETVFPESPEMMASRVGELIECGTNIIGGCCGTTPEHIKQLAVQVDQIK